MQEIPFWRRMWLQRGLKPHTNEESTMKTVYAMMLVTGLLAVLILLQPASSHAAGDSTKGKPIYEKYCTACHGPQGKGDGPAGKMLKPPAADFTRDTSKKKSEANLREIAENGKPGTAMGPWKGQLSQTEMSDVIEYVMALRK